MAENSDVVSQLQVSDTVEVLEEWRLWPIAPRIVQDGEDITFYEDYDIAYTNQTEYWKPHANVGPPAVAIMATGTASVTVDFVGDRSFAVSPGATLTSFNWSAPGSSESSSTSQGTEGTPVTFTYTSAGQYVVSLTVTDSNGNVAINYTKVFVIDPFNLGDNVHTVFDSISDNMDWQQGGTESNFIVYGTASVNQFPREGRVLHVVRGNPTTPTATWPNRSNILFNGYIVGTSISQNINRNTVSFRAITIDGLMKNLPVYPVSLTDNNSPSEWPEAKDITIDRCLTFLAHYRSTLSLMASIIPLNYTAEIQRQDFNPGVLYNQMEELLKDGWAHCASSHQGVLYWERDYNLMTTYRS